jgi:hypothetical protein
LDEVDLAEQLLQDARALQERGDFDGAEVVLRRAARVFESAREPGLLGIALLGLGETLESLNRHGEAAEAFSRSADSFEVFGEVTDADWSRLKEVDCRLRDGLGSDDGAELWAILDGVEGRAHMHRNAQVIFKMRHLKLVIAGLRVDAGRTQGP